MALFMILEIMSQENFENLSTEEGGDHVLFRTLYEKEREDEERWALEKIKRESEEEEGKEERRGSFGGVSSLDSILAFLLPKSMRRTGEPDEQDIEERVVGEGKGGKGKGKGRVKKGKGKEKDDGRRSYGGVGGGGGN